VGFLSILAKNNYQTGLHVRVFLSHALEIHLCQRGGVVYKMGTMHYMGPKIVQVASTRGFLIPIKTVATA